MLQPMSLRSKDYPAWVCIECGLKASQAMGKVPPAFSVSTSHEGVCGVCGKTKAVIDPRDYFYPDFDIEEKE